MSVDRIKMSFECVYLGPNKSDGLPFRPSKRAQGPGGAWLKAAAKKLPFFYAIRSHQDHEHSTPVWTIEFRAEGTRLLTAHVVQTEDGDLLLAKVDMNLAALLHGHNGTLPSSPEDYHLSLTRAAWLLEPLLKDDCKGYFLRRDSRGGCCWRIYYLEAAVQFEDATRQLILDAHVSQFKGYRKMPLIVPGETVTLRSDEMDFTVYSKSVESDSKHGFFSGRPITRVEAKYKTSRAMTQALGLKARSEVRAIPFTALATALKHTVDEKIVGGLVSPKGKEAGVPRGSTRRVLDTPCPADMHAALHDECQLMDPPGRSKLKQRVFDHFARTRPTDLYALVSQVVAGSPMARLEIEHIERRFEEQCLAFDAPMTADAAVTEAFSVMRVSEPEQP